MQENLFITNNLFPLMRKKGLGRPSIRSLFTASERGVYYDPSDLTTLFQNAAGTIPVTAPGQPVGLVLDKSGRGNRASQPTAAARPTLGRHPKGGRRNLLLQTEDLASANWSKTGATTAQPLGDGVFRITNFSEAAGDRINQNIPISPSELTAHIEVRGEGSDIGKELNLVAKRVSGTLAIATTSVTLTAQWQRVSASFVMAADNTRAGLYLATPSTNSASAPLVRFPQLEVGPVATPYQKVTDQFDVTEAGVPDAWYLHFNGVNQFLSTPAIDFTGTDEMFVSAAVRKLSDTSTGFLTEFGQTDTLAGSFGIAAPGLSGNNPFYLRSRGTTMVTSAVTSGFAAPVSAVVTGIADISSNLADLRINSALVASNTATQGTGSYGNYPLVIGARSSTGTALFLHGQVYGITVRGKLPTEAELTATETALSNTMRIAT